MNRPLPWERLTAEGYIYRRLNERERLYKASLGPIGWDVGAIDDSSGTRVYVQMQDGRVYFCLMSVFRALAKKDTLNDDAGEQYFLPWPFWARVYL